MRILQKMEFYCTIKYFIDHHCTCIHNIQPSSRIPPLSIHHSNVFVHREHPLVGAWLVKLGRHQLLHSKHHPILASDGYGSAEGRQEVDEKVTERSLSSCTGAPTHADNHSKQQHAN